MKKLFAILLTIAILLIPMSLTVGAAAALNADEQRIIAALKEKVNVNGIEVKIPENYVTQAENYLKTIEVSKAQADEIIAYIAAGQEIIKDTDIKNSTDLKVLAQGHKEEILELGQKASAVVNATLTYDGKDVTIVSNETGAVLFDAAPIVKTTGADVDFSAMAVVLSSVAVILGVAFVASKKIGLLK